MLYDIMNLNAALKDVNTHEEITRILAMFCGDNSALMRSSSVLVSVDRTASGIMTIRFNENTAHAILAVRDPVVPYVRPIGWHKTIVCSWGPTDGYAKSGIRSRYNLDDNEALMSRVLLYLSSHSHARMRCAREI